MNNYYYTNVKQNFPGGSENEKEIVGKVGGRFCARGQRIYPLVKQAVTRGTMFIFCREIGNMTLVQMFIAALTVRQPTRLLELVYGEW